MLLYRTSTGAVLQIGQQWFPVNHAWEDLVNDDDLPSRLRKASRDTPPQDSLAAAVEKPLAPLGDRQELWAAGVTYYRSRTARMEESQAAGGGNFYDKVYAAERPEIFFKATPHRVVGPGESLHLRRDSKWIVPEPELVLVISRSGRIVGYTAGNDLSCRDIEGENPLYLPQAKTFQRCAAVGPAVLVAEQPLDPETTIGLIVRRGDKAAVEGGTTLAQMKRTPEELVDFLFRENSHPFGCLLMTGTGVIPEGEFTLQVGDVVEITIEGIGTLSNSVE